MAGKTEITPLTDAALAELTALHAGLHCSFGGIGGKIVDAFPQLIARLEAAELEREELRKSLEAEERAHLRTIDSRDAHEERINEIGAVLGLDEAGLTWSNLSDVGQNCLDEIAARDARMKKLGAIEAYDEMRKQAVEVGKESGLAAKFCKLFAEQCIEAAAQLRRESEER